MYCSDAYIFESCNNFNKINSCKPVISSFFDFLIPVNNYSNISSLYYKIFYKINVDNYLFYENILYLLQLNAI